MYLVHLPYKSLVECRFHTFTYDIVTILTLIMVHIHTYIVEQLKCRLNMGIYALAKGISKCRVYNKSDFTVFALNFKLYLKEGPYVTFTLPLLFYCVFFFMEL